MPWYDAGRFGFAPHASPRLVDVTIVPAFFATDGAWVVSMASCAGGGHCRYSRSLIRGCDLDYSMARYLWPLVWYASGHSFCLLWNMM